MPLQAVRGPLSLLPDTLLRLENEAGGMVCCHEGMLWITSADSPGDSFLHPGERYRIPGPGLVLIECLRPAQLQLLTKA